MKCEHCKWFAVERQEVEDYAAPRVANARGQMVRPWKWVSLGRGECRFNPPEAGKGFPVVTEEAWCRQFEDRASDE